MVHHVGSQQIDLRVESGQKSRRFGEEKLREGRYTLENEHVEPQDATMNINLEH